MLGIKMKMPSNCGECPLLEKCNNPRHPFVICKASVPPKETSILDLAEGFSVDCPLVPAVSLERIKQLREEIDKLADDSIVWGILANAEDSDIDAITEKINEYYRVTIFSLIDKLIANEEVGVRMENKLTREEAIKLIKQHKDLDVLSSSKTAEALEMGAEALEQISKLQNRCYALSRGTLCVFCKMECEARKK